MTPRTRWQLRRTILLWYTVGAVLGYLAAQWLHAH